MYMKTLAGETLREAIQRAATLALREGEATSFHFNGVVVVVPPDSDLLSGFCDEGTRVQKTREIKRKYQKELARL